MNILVVCPTQSECSNFKECLSKVSKTKHSYHVVNTGVGKVNVAASVSLEVNGLVTLQNNPIDLVAVIGYAAGSQIFERGDIIIPSSCRYHDCSVPEGLVPELTQVYQLAGSDEVLCLTGDSFVDQELASKLCRENGNAVIFDMEAAAVAQVCDDLSIPVLVIKMISDIPQEAGYESYEEFVNSHPDFSAFLRYLESL